MKSRGWFHTDGVPRFPHSMPARRTARVSCRSALHALYASPWRLICRTFVRLERDDHPRGKTHLASSCWADSSCSRSTNHVARRRFQRPDVVTSLSTRLRPSARPHVMCCCSALMSVRAIGREGRLPRGPAAQSGARAISSHNEEGGARSKQGQTGQHGAPQPLNTLRSRQTCTVCLTC